MNGSEFACTLRNARPLPSAIALRLCTSGVRVPWSAEMILRAVDHREMALTANVRCATAKSGSQYSDGRLLRPRILSPKKISLQCAYILS
jgi:hypothetical protein